jgi:hypothetical protein
VNFAEYFASKFSSTVQASPSSSNKWFCEAATPITSTCYTVLFGTLLRLSQDRVCGCIPAKILLSYRIPRFRIAGGQLLQRSNCIFEHCFTI